MAHDEVWTRCSFSLPDVLMRGVDVSSYDWTRVLATVLNSVEANGTAKEERKVRRNAASERKDPDDVRLSFLQ